MRQNIQIRPPDTLQRAVMIEVRQFFDTRTAHRPSEHMFEALADIPKTVSDIITGSAKKAYHVCQLDTGVGKSITLAKTIKTLRAPGMSWSAGQVGTVICVGRYTQIKTMAEDMQLQPSEFAVLVSSAAPAEIQQLGMGVDRINEAPILLTTHSMVQSRLSKAGHTWANTREFFYMGRPRPLRVWDEALLPGLPVILKMQDIHLALGAQWGGKEVYDALYQLQADLHGAKHDQVLQMPDVADMVDLPVALGKTQGRHAVSQEAIIKIWLLSGQAARACNDGPTGTVALSFKRVMPDDVKPMLVLDASARARATYRHQAAATNDVVFLKYAKKWYDRVTIHVKDAPSGKGHFANNYHKVLEQVGQIINQNPHRKALVLHHKPSGGIKDTPRDLPNHLLHPENVGYCSWGQHNSTNEFFDKDLIVTASVLFHARSTITATGRTVSNVPADEEYEDELYQEMKDGELKNDLLQALSRGALRQCDGDQARDCVIYITAPKNREIRKVLAGLFPGATIKTDTTDQNGSDITGLTEREDSILWHLRKHLMGDPPVLTFPEVYKALNMNRQTLSKIAGRGQFNEVLRSWGYAIIRRSPPQPAMFVPEAHVGHWLFGDGPPKAEETHAGDF